MHNITIVTTLHGTLLRLSRMLSESFNNVTMNCRLRKSKCFRIIGTWIDRELTLVDRSARNQYGESQEWGFACRWHGDITQLSTPRKVGNSDSLVDRQITNDLILGRRPRRVCVGGSSRRNCSGKMRVKRMFVRLRRSRITETEIEIERWRRVGRSPRKLFINEMAGSVGDDEATGKLHGTGASSSVIPLNERERDVSLSLSLSRLG